MSNHIRYYNVICQIVEYNINKCNWTHFSICAGCNYDRVQMVLETLYKIKYFSY